MEKYKTEKVLFFDRGTIEQNSYFFFGSLLFLYLFIPFRFWKPFVFPNQIEEILVSISMSLILFVLVITKSSSGKWYVNRIDLLVFIYWVYCLLRSSLPFDKEWAFQHASLFFIYLFFRNLRIGSFLWLLCLLPLAGIVQIIDGIHQFSMPWHNLSHITGIFHNTGIFGGFISVACTICLGFITISKSDKFYLIKIGWAILLSMLTIQLAYSNSRASSVALGVSGTYLLFQCWNRSSERRKISFPTKIVLGISCLVILVFLSLYLYQLKKDSADGRLLIGRVSLEMIADKPFLGNGIHGFRSDYMNHQASYFEEHPDSPVAILADDVVTPFNEYLKILVEQGIAGLILFLLLLTAVFGKKHDRESACQEGNTRIITKAVLVSVLSFALFSYPFDNYPFLVIFVSCLAVAAQNTLSGYSFSGTSPYSSGLRLAAYSLSACLIVVLSPAAFNYGKACLAWNRALKNYSFNKEESLLQLKNQYIELKENPVFLTTYGKALARNGSFEESGRILKQAIEQLPCSDSYIELGKVYENLGLEQQALSSWKTAGYIVPARFTPGFLAMKLYEQKGNDIKAKELANRILAKKVKVDHPEVDEMIQEAQRIKTLSAVKINQKNIL